MNTKQLVLPDGLSVNELATLAATDFRLFTRSYFGTTFRQNSPEDHTRMWDALENPAHRLVNLRCYRGSGKTTLLRAFTGKRVAYNLSRTIMYVGASEGHAARSIQWMRARIERNDLFRESFGLRPGSKWSDTEIEIIHGVEEQPIWVKGFGITGNIRGVNFDDYRPDLIILDDIVTDENGSSLEQRDKIQDLVFGALLQSLVPKSEDPNAKMVMAQTPINPEDVSALAIKDESWHTEEFSCWTPETRDLPTQFQQSSWEERFSTEELRTQKEGAVAMGRYSIFAKEMEVKLVTSEKKPMRREWLNFYTDHPRTGTVVLAIDPVPPPTDKQIEKDFHNKDFEAQAVWLRSKGQYYLLDYVLNRGHDVNWSIAKTFELAQRWRVSQIVVETVAFQKVLADLLRQEMIRRQKYYPLFEYKDKRSKFNRVTGVIAPIAALGLIHCRERHTDFIRQFTDFPGSTHDRDLIDASAIALDHIINPFIEMNERDDGVFDEEHITDLELGERCP